MLSCRRFQSAKIVLFQKSGKKDPSVPDNIHGSGPHLGIAAHDGNAGSKRAVNAKDDKLCSSRDNGQVAVCKRVVPPTEQTDEMSSDKILKHKKEKDGIQLEQTFWWDASNWWEQIIFLT